MGIKMTSYFQVLQRWEFFSSRKKMYLFLQEMSVFKDVYFIATNIIVP